MTMNKRLFAVAALAALAIGGIYAQTAATTQRGARFREFVAGYLNLTAAQTAQAQTIFDDTQTAVQPVVADLKILRGQMETAVKSNSTATIDSLSLQIGKDVGTMSAIRLKGLAKFYAILTPDQQAKAGKLHDQFSGMMGHRFGS